MPGLHPVMKKTIIKNLDAISGTLNWLKYIAERNLYVRYGEVFYMYCALRHFDSYLIHNCFGLHDYIERIYRKVEMIFKMWVDKLHEQWEYPRVIISRRALEWHLLYDQLNVVHRKIKSAGTSLLISRRSMDNVLQMAQDLRVHELSKYTFADLYEDVLVTDETEDCSQIFQQLETSFTPINMFFIIKRFMFPSDFKNVRLWEGISEKARFLFSTLRTVDHPSSGGRTLAPEETLDVILKLLSFRDNLRCPICLEKMNAQNVSIVDACDHLFCYSCLKDLEKIKS